MLLNHGLHLIVYLIISKIDTANRVAVGDVPLYLIRILCLLLISELTQARSVR